MNHQAPSVNRYAFLDGIRGLAALFVVTRHTHLFWGDIQFFRSYLAVDIFFILSGFVIIHAYEKKLTQQNISNKQFVKLRLIRLYPIFLFSLLVSLAAFLMESLSNHSLATLSWLDVFITFVPVLFFLPSNYSGQGYLFSVNVPYWSLLDELIVNFIYVLMRPKLSNLVLAIIIFSSALVIGAISILNESINVGFVATVPNMLGGLVRALFGFFVGVALYRNQLFFARWIPQVSPWWAFLVVALILGSPSLGAADKFLDVFLITIAFPLIIFIAAQGQASRHEKILLPLGAISYPLYVLHEPVGKMFTSIASYSVKQYAPLSGFILVAMLVVMCLLLDKYYDIPVRRYLSTRFIPKQPRQKQ